MKFLGLWGVLVVAFGAIRAEAFPEMVRHGYLSCVACHFNPNGGGILRPFGRAIAGDQLSTATREGESEFLYGIIKNPPDWLHLGGDVRWIQTYRNTNSFREAKPILMQADLEAAVETGEWTLAGTIGRDGRNGNAVSRRHYVVFRPSAEPRLYVQAGRFARAFGINTPEHTLVTKRGLGWDEGSETDNLQVAWMDQKFDVFLGASLGRGDLKYPNRETGVAVRPRYYLGSRARAGVSYFYGNSPTDTRHVFGPFTSIGFSEKCFLLLEVDLQARSPRNTGGEQWGIVNYLRLDYELIQGLHVFLTQEFAKLNFLSTASTTNSFGVGVQFFPRPHLEVNLAWQKLRMLQVADEYQDLAWLMLHFYL